MNPTKTLCIALLCSFSTVTLCITGQAQVVAGISANGRVMVHGDTINVCRGSTLTYLSTAQGSSAIIWRFKNGTPGTMTGTGPFTIAYNTNGFDTTFQKAGTGAFSDSMFIIVRVFDDKPIAAFDFLPNSACGNEAIQFTNSTVVGEPFRYLWDFGDGATSIDADPSHQYLSAVGSGTQNFPVKLIVTNASGCIDSTSHSVTIRSVPDASIANADPGVTVGSYQDTFSFKTCNDDASYNFKFINESTTLTTNVSYHISWGDGTPDTVFANWPTGNVINHDFPRGSSTMTLSVTGSSGCIGIRKYIVYVGIFPGGGLTNLGTAEICETDSLDFAVTNTAINSPGTSYLFYINDGSQSQIFPHPVQPVIGHRFNKNSCSNLSDNGNQIIDNAFGAYLLIQNPCGVSSASIVPIYVSGKPRAVISASDTAICVNNTVSLINTSSFGNVITPTGAASSTCEDKGKNVWTIIPSTGFTILGGLGNLNGSGVDQSSWVDGSDSLDVQFMTPGVYTVKLYVGNERCGIDSTTTTICVRNTPQASFTMSQKAGCGPTIVDLSNTSPANSCDAADDEYLWTVIYNDTAGCSVLGDPAWSFANGTTETSKSPSLSMSAVGRYIIQLRVKASSTADGCTDATIADTFYIKGVLNVSLAMLPTVCANNNIHPAAQVTRCYSVGPYSYQWFFTNGAPATSTDSLPGAVSYALAGTHSVQLIVTDSSCMQGDTVNTAVTVVPLPITVVVNDTSVCSGETISLGGTAIPGVIYQWSPVTGLSDAAAANPAVALTYNGPANDTTYTYYMAVSQGEHCKKTDSVKILVKRVPMVTIDPVTAQICSGSNTTLLATGADSYQWSPAATLISSGAASVIANPPTTTTYTVIGELTNGCSAEQSVTVTVYEKPVAEFNVTPLKICTGQQISVTNTSSNATGYEWSWGDGTNSSFENGQHIYNTAGSYPLSLLATRTDVSGFTCSDTVTKHVDVIDKIRAQINAGPESKCVPYMLNVNAANITGADLIEWIFYDSSAAPGEFESTGLTASHLYSRAGSYAVRLVVHSATGCTDTAFYQFNVSGTPFSTFDPLTASICGNDTTVNFIASTQSAEDETINYKWYVNESLEGTSNSFTRRFTRSAGSTVPHTFDIRLEAQNASGCGQTSVKGQVILYPVPATSIQVSPSLVQQQPNYEFTFRDMQPADANKIHTWSMGDRTGQTKEGQQVSFQYGDTGTYKVRLLVKDFLTGCEAMDSATVSILHVPGYIQVPNAMCPGCSNFAVRKFLPLAKGLKKYRLRIYTTWGQKVFETTSLDASGSPNIPWDGTLNGKPLQQDVYSWQIEGVFQNGTEWKGMIYPGSNKPVKAGFITVIK
jgi:hypothetical protein